MDKIKIFVLVIFLLVVGTVATALVRGVSNEAPKPGQYDAFARCIKDSGAIFYGAFWCPHCQAQKKLFGTAVKFLPYVECSNADASAQTQICIDKGIKSYPTWVFPDGSELSGEVALKTLADRTGCMLPDDTSNDVPVSAGESSSASPVE